MTIVIRSLADLEMVQQQGLRSLYPDKPKISVGMATCGLATGAREVLKALEEETRARDFALSQTGCIGYCQKEPLIQVWQPDRPMIVYEGMTPERAKGLIDSIAKGGVREEWALGRIDEEEFLITGETQKYLRDGVPEAFKKVPRLREIPFFKKQLIIALRNCGFIDPDNIEEYSARGGYLALYNALTEMKPEEIIEEVKKSGLRGRGGAGFPTGVKWESCRRAEGDIKYVICNADEGDPGAYMDRSILEGDPHSVLEGMTIGAYAIGAHEGYIYVRNEYPMAVEKLRIALQQARAYGLLGQDIFGTGFSFDIKIHRGAGAFVCGESTALMASLEGKVGEPRAKYVHTVEKGVWDRPSSLNNVETWNNVPVIISRSADWFSRIGTKGSKGTKVFSVVGKIRNTGLVEVPMGITLREIVQDIGGGILEGKRFKAVQTGGPSGGCLPESLLNLPVDFDSLWEAGSMMGSGGMIVMDEDTCMVDLAKYFISFLREESCGKCIPCREGLRNMLEILERIAEGKGREEDLELLEALGEWMKDASLCGLGQSAPNPVLSTIRYFQDEYEAHIRNKKCPAGACSALVAYRIDPVKCVGCMLCVMNCPGGAAQGEKGKPVRIDSTKCLRCGVCYDVCKKDAVIRE
jgi:NADH:ubiquinone oxidoreductase subunit F (NADH-binding)/NAD-dependent dihydropyrimidine dehydrogenase PreA subunit/(2Fe-2S) ferredoxin